MCVSVSDNRTLETGKMINIRPVHLKFLGCPTKDCSPPKDPSTLPPATSRPKTAVLWSATESWKNAEDGYGGNYGAGKYGPPKTDGDNVKIPTGTAHPRRVCINLHCCGYNTPHFSIDLRWYGSYKACVSLDPRWYGSYKARVCFKSLPRLSLNYNCWRNLEFKNAQDPDSQGSYDEKFIYDIHGTPWDRYLLQSYTIFISISI